MYDAHVRCAWSVTANTSSSRSKGISEPCMNVIVSTKSPCCPSLPPSLPPAPNRAPHPRKHSPQARA